MQMDNKKNSTQNVDLERMLLDGNAKPICLPFSLLEEITNCFSNDRIIGSGGFAVVYKGVIGEGRVAVKKLSEMIHEKTFYREIECLTKTKHKNIVRFLGYCADTHAIIADDKGKFVMADTRKWLLCFEYIPEGSLAQYIADTERLTALSAETKAQTCEEGGICQGAAETRQYLELDKLSEDMLHHIHSLMPVQDAARAACVSRRFLRSWRRYSNLVLNRTTLGLTDDKSKRSEMRYINRIDQILNNHPGNGMHVKALRIDLLGCTSVHASYLDRWLRIAVKSGIVELRLSLPCSMAEKLPRRDYSSCSQNLLPWSGCKYIYAVVEISAPNLSTFHYNGFPPEISIRDPSQLKDVCLISFSPSRIVSYGRAKLPSLARSVERLTISSCGENVNTPMLPDKFLHLISLEVIFHRFGDSSMYDIFSVLSFLDASPALESFILHAERDAIIRDCVADDDVSYLSGESAYKHNRLRWVKITGFHSAKSLIKLVIHILESAPSLEALTLDTTFGYGRKPGDTRRCTIPRVWGKSCWISERDLEDAKEAVEAAGRYVAGRVPSAVEFNVLEPCRQCNTGNP